MKMGKGEVKMINEDYDEFFERLAQKGVNFTCPVCGATKMTTTNDYAQLPVGEGDRLNPFKSKRCIYVTCDECGYVRMFDLEKAIK